MTGQSWMSSSSVSMRIGYVRIESFLLFLRRMERRLEREMGKILSGIHENDVAWD